MQRRKDVGVLHLDPNIVELAKNSTGLLSGIIGAITGTIALKTALANRPFKKTLFLIRPKFANALNSISFWEHRVPETVRQ